jgi:hypothetical protein
VLSAQDGGFAAFGGDCWSCPAIAIKFDEAGSVEWQWKYGESDYYYGYVLGPPFEISSVTRGGEGGFVVAGDHWAAGASVYDARLEKIGADGNLERPCGQDVKQAFGATFRAASETMASSIASREEKTLASIAVPAKVAAVRIPRGPECESARAGVTIWPDPVVFPDAPVGCASSTAAVYIGGYCRQDCPDVSLVSMEFSPPGTFAFADGPALPMEVLKKGEREFTLRYAPTREGGETGIMTLTLADEAVSDYVTVRAPLRGKGVASLEVVDRFASPGDTTAEPVSFPLSRTPDLLTLRVTVDDAPVLQNPDDGYFYQAADNSIVLNGAARPRGSEKVEVRYGVGCDTN